MREKILNQANHTLVLSQSIDGSCRLWTAGVETAQANPEPEAQRVKTESDDTAGNVVDDVKPILDQANNGPPQIVSQ